MKKVCSCEFFILILLLFFTALPLCAQVTTPHNNRVLYVVDSIPVTTTPADHEQLTDADVAYYNVLTSPDTRKTRRYRAYDSVIFVFTKAYVERPPDVKRIPSTAQLIKINELYYYKRELYTGKVIDYYYNGKIKHRGAVKEGRFDGTHFHYDERGRSFRRTFSNKSNGKARIVDTDSTGRITRQQILYDNKPELLETYYENGQVQFQSVWKKDKRVAVSYYSSGLLMDSTVYVIRQGKRSLQKSPYIAAYEELMKNKEYNKACVLYPGYPGPYSALAAACADTLQFDAALRYMDTCITLEPYDPFAYLLRAFIRIRQHAYTTHHIRLMNENEINRFLDTRPAFTIPSAEKQKILNDLRKSERVEFIDNEYRKLFRHARNGAF